MPGTRVHFFLKLFPVCSGLLHPDVVLFGESLPDEAWKISQECSRKANLFVVVGSSLVVSPANYLPQMAVEAGAKLLIINQEPTPLDHLATWTIRVKAAEILPVIAQAIKTGKSSKMRN